jgi:hypothetical protein
MDLAEVYSDVPPDWRADLEAFTERLTSHAWGGDVDVRLVVADDVAAALEEWMRPDEWTKERDALALYGEALMVGGKAFLARDGRWTIAITRPDEKDLFLMLVGHELVEVAIEQRQHASGEDWDGVSPEAQAHILWSEYVVERVRAEIARELGFEASSQETCRALLKTLTLAAKPALTTGFIRKQAWHDLMLMWARVLGRTDGGRQEEAADLETFYAHPVMAEVTAHWTSLAGTLRKVFERPEASSVELDRLVVPKSTVVFENRPSPPH